MIKSVIQRDENLIALDLNSFLFRTPLSSQTHNVPMYDPEKVWRLLQINTQLLPNGQVIAISCQDTLAMFKRVSSISHKEGTEPFLGTPSTVLLALTGQYAQYVGGYLGRLPVSFDTTTAGVNTTDGTREATLEKYRQKIWKDSVEQWLAEQEYGISVEEDTWVEVEVPLYKADTDRPVSEDFSQMGRIIWKSIFWPASLCYVNTVDQPLREDTEPFPRYLEDPLQFAEDWIASAADREAAIRKMELDMEVPIERDRAEELDTSHSNNVHVDAGQSFRRVTSLDGQGMPAIYPTPPDGALSHVTPGVSSVDGLGDTPGEGAVPGQADRTIDDVEMMDLIGGQAAIGSGLYDEDLFEDVPGEKFGEAEMADEPNWDFFDEPDADMMEDADHMELDLPEKAASAVEENRTVSGGKVEHANDRYGDALPENHDHEIGRPALDKAQDSEVTIFADNEAPHVLEERSEPPAMIGVRQTAPANQPLSPAEVRKKLFPDMASPNSYQMQQSDKTRPSRRSLLQSHFDPNSFRPQLKVADSRYSANGFFWFEPKEGETASSARWMEQYLNMPRIGVVKKERSILVPARPRTSEPSGSPSSAEDTDFDSSDFFSENNKQGSPDRSNSNEADSLAVSPQPVGDVLDSGTEARIREEAVKLLELLRPEVKEWLSGRNHLPLQRRPDARLPISREKLVTVAQVVVDQVSQSFFHCDRPDSSWSAFEVRNIDIFQQLQSIYGDATELDLAKLTNVPASTQDAVEGHGLAESPSPFIRITRSDANIDALPTIQPFWETLGLQPVSGKKNITAFCIHPATAHISEGSSAFMQRFSEIYSNCNLGNHTSGYLQDMTSNGLIEWNVGKESRMQDLLKVCERLGSSLATLPSSAENFMVYIVNPFKDRSAIADICNIYVTLFTNYARACGKSKSNELILQIIPMSFIASSDTVVIPTQAEYLSLALEVYNRCPVTNPSGAVAESGAAVTLAEPVPENITFKLASDATSPLSRDSDILHLAYSQSVDLRWVIACWTDNLGKTALTMTYCLREKGSSISRPRSEIIKDMWEISGDIMTKTGGKWRLSVAHDGPIEPEETNEWSFLANQSSSNGSISQCVLSLLTFDEHPSIQFFPPIPQNKPQPLPQALAITTTAIATATATGKYGTPASTPSAFAMTSSPEQLIASTPIPPTPGASSGLPTAPTPPEQISQPHGFDMSTDPEATLIDLIDECWSLLLPFGLNNSTSPLDSRPALLSGFLLKRRGQFDGDGVAALGVNLIYSSSSADITRAEQKALLREVIDRWRDLYTLARTKGWAGEGGVLPWHVKTALKGCRAVSEVL